MVVATITAACGSDPSPLSGESPLPAPDPDGGNGPVVETVPATTALPPLDPNADPRTPLGELRARYLPIWSPDFDWAFPPEVCGSDWALDAIAHPIADANLAILGDPVAAAALSVMRYEFVLSRALSEPDILKQLCIAVATVDPVRRDGLDLLAGHLTASGRGAETAAFPNEVTVVAASPTDVLAVACVTPAGSAEVTGPGEIASDTEAPPALHAYLLAVSRGIEDTVADISYRVSNVSNRQAQSCEETTSWAAEWHQRAAGWAEEGELWAPVGETVTVEQLCSESPADGPQECPRDWLP